MSDWTPDTWGEVLALLGVAGICLAALDYRIRIHIDNRLHTVRDQIRDEMRDLTQLIRPGVRNGGSSLTDIAARMQRLETHLGIQED